MNVIIPIAGPDQVRDETQYIRSLQEIERKTILQYVFESLTCVDAEHFIVVIKQKDAMRYHLDDIVRLLRPGAEIVLTEKETLGAACTCMLAIDYLKLEAPLLITGSDQIILEPVNRIISSFGDLDGGVAIFDDVHPRWSYVRLDEQNHVIEAAEKRPISRNAVAGLYYYKKAEFFFHAAKQMIRKDASVNGRFFICPAFNEMVLSGQKIGAYHIEKEQYYSFSHVSGIDAYKAYLADEKIRRNHV